MAQVAERAGYRVVPAGNGKLAAVAGRLPDDPALRAAFRMELERMTRESRWTGQAHVLLSRLDLLEERPSDAAAELEKAIAIDPRNEELRKELAALKP